MTAAIQANEGNNARYANMFTQHFRGLARQHAGYDSYIMNSQNFQWGVEYQQIIHQGKIVIEKAVAEGNKPLEGIAKLMQAWTYGNLTSLYGNIPFTEADQFETIKEPKFDDQMTVVYPGIQALLDAAIADLGGAGGITGDIFLSNSATNWVAAAYTLKARYYLHVKDYANALTAAANGISAAANDVLATHNGTTQSGRNLWNDFLELQRTTDYGATGSFLATFIGTGGAKNNAKTNESARYADIFAVNSDGDLDINYFGTSSLFSATSSFPLITYRENQLIIAEANARLGNDAAAITALNNVRASLAAQYTAGTYTAYVAADAEVSTNAALITEIVRERYVTLVGQIEVFNDMRRNKNAMGITPSTGTALPGRFLYPNAELQSNTNAPQNATLFDVLPVFQ
ncbi:hypothetical protein BKI52_29210 [marine bacterium AO1-C]|nr:hypothetical protein BKI52_29210 [marine bacterium AO1-C]